MIEMRHAPEPAGVESETSFGGTPSFQLGDRFLVSASGSYAWSEASVSSFVFSWSHAQKNKGIIPPFATEALNSNSNVYRVQLGHAFIHGNWSFGPSASFLFRDENSYDPTAFQFVPAKTRMSAGGNMRYRVTDCATAYVSAEHIWIHEGQRIFPGANALPTPALSCSGWSVAGGATFRY
jgi:hypothetical protein